MIRNNFRKEMIESVAAVIKLRGYNGEQAVTRNNTKGWDFETTIYENGVATTKTNYHSNFVLSDEELNDAIEESKSV